MTTHARSSIRSIRAGRAALFAAGYGTVALAWTVTGRGFPFGASDPGHDSSPLRALTPQVGAPLFAAVLLLAAVATLIMKGADLRGPARAALLTYCWAVVAGLLLLVPDTRLLTLAGYLPIIVVGAPFGYPPVDYSTVFTTTLAGQAAAVVAGLLLATATLRWQLRTGDACVGCGRGDREAGWSRPEAAARWGRWAAWTAAVIPAVYALTRFAWAAGIPLGISAGFLEEMHETGLVWSGAGLGAFAMAGAVLTLGLVQRWGEVFPRWMPGLAGRRVPIRLATVPATVVAVFVTSAAIGFVTADGFRSMISGDLSMATLPMVLWPFWGVALGAAALAYHLRRRGGCRECGRGRSGVVPVEQADAY